MSLRQRLSTGAILSVIFLVPLWSAGSDFLMWRLAQFWPTTEVTIVGHRIDVMTTSGLYVRGRGRQEHTNFQREVDYIYSVDNDLYQGKQVDVGVYSSLNDILEPLLRGLPLGSTHLIHYDPKFRSASSLYPGGLSLSDWTGLFVAFVFYGVIAYHLRPRALDVFVTFLSYWLVLGLGVAVRWQLSDSGDQPISAYQDSRAIAAELGKVVTPGRPVPLEPGMTLQTVASILGPPIAVKVRDDGALIMTGGGKQKSRSLSARDSRCSPLDPEGDTLTPFSFPSG